MNKSCPCCGHPFDETEAKAGGWISVDDELSEINTNIIIYTIIGKQDIVQRITTSDGDYFYDNFTDEVWQKQEVTHWMLLPSIEGLEG